MARLADPGADAAVRRYLIEARSALRSQLTQTMLDHSAESAKTTWAELSKSIDPLIAGMACSVRRFELPDGHPMRPRGHPCDLLLLDEHDRLRSSARALRSELRPELRG